MLQSIVALSPSVCQRAPCLPKWRSKSFSPLKKSDERSTDCKWFSASDFSHERCSEHLTIGERARVGGGPRLSVAVRVEILGNRSSLLRDYVDSASPCTCTPRVEEVLVQHETHKPSDSIEVKITYLIRGISPLSSKRLTRATSPQNTIDPPKLHLAWFHG